MMLFPDEQEVDSSWIPGDPVTPVPDPDSLPLIFRDRLPLLHLPETPVARCKHQTIT